MHYAPDGKAATTDQTRIGFIYAKAAPTRRIDEVTIVNQQLEIPAGEPDHEVAACYHFARERTLLSLKPHMHLRGKDARLTVVWPDGRREPLLFVPRWDFDWQLTYVLAAPLRLVPGTRLEINAHYDNSAGNRRNPDPTRVVTWDESSAGEMLAAMLMLTAPVAP